MKRALAMVLAVCALLGAVAAAFVMAAAWGHNPQGVYHEMDVGGSETIHWEAWGLLGLSWFLIVFVPTSLLGSGVMALSYDLDAQRCRERR
jgi:hypothetical protein